MEILGSVTIGEAAQTAHRQALPGRAAPWPCKITPASRDEKLHALRIRCKQLRYLLEFFRPAYGGLLKAETRRLKKLQDVLGDFQDACVAGETASPTTPKACPCAAGNRGQLIALGQLIGGQDRQAAMCRADFAGAWERFDSTGGRTGLLTRLAQSEAAVGAKHF